eukprot:TRINITY_DN7686_c0_g1_i2.p1 TRINITY_DN7686_c0_g1~~TRINITY_DN7686_c0_g1_i2.p1  ORF type:complete len:325 (+),score=49.03 TRINITY_DN7686_c0_g1_i2:71-1045(+)
MSRPRKPSDYVNKAIPKSTKYADVQSVVDTGPNLKKVLDQPRVIFARFKKESEIFQRVRPSELATALELGNKQAQVDLDESFSSRLSLGSSAEFSSQRHDSGSILRPEPARGSRTMMDVDDTRMYLLLDLRDPEDYEKCHIATAISYPVRMLSRAINCFTPEIYKYRNQEGKIIICYDDDEKIGTQACTVIYQRDIDNIALLTGGLRYFADKYPQFIIGTPPPPPPSSMGSSRGGSRPGTSGSVSSRPSTSTSSVRNASPRTFGNTAVSTDFGSRPGTTSSGMSGTSRRPSSAPKRPSSGLGSARRSSTPTQNRFDPETAPKWR